MEIVELLDDNPDEHSNNTAGLFPEVFKTVHPYFPAGFYFIAIGIDSEDSEQTLEWSFDPPLKVLQ